VRSVLSQTYPHWELIIIDDGSNDTTLDLTSRFAENLADGRVRIIHQQNQGVAAARNNGFTQARGSYIAFLDADDVWLPQKLMEEVAVLRAKTTSENPACLVYSSY
jgi:glycosyltransferase involved in cell wall biosynthesis